MAQTQSFYEQTEMLSHIFSLMEAFRAFDANNNGLISTAELSVIMGSLGYRVAQQDVVAMMRKGDSDGDGLLSIEEFLEMNTKEMEELGDMLTLLITASEALNVDGEDSVTGSELYEVMGDMGIGLSLENCKEIIASMDGNGDGTVNFKDFKLIVNSLLWFIYYLSKSYMYAKSTS